METLFVASFLAGVLTIAAPCILPLLPVIIGGAAVSDSKKRDWLRPLVIAASLGVSVILFTLLLKATTSLLGVPQYVWQVISGVLVMLLGVHFVWPSLWERLPFTARLNINSQQALGAARQRKGIFGAILIGAALGPIFNSCSPTYLLIVATILLASLSEGLTYLFAYALGLSSILLLVAYFGQSLVRRLGWLANPNGWFHHFIGVLFLLVGIAVIFGLDKQLQTFILERGWYAPVSDIERSLR